jgi:RNA-directed DNA polymerase
MDTVDQQLMYEWKDLPWHTIERRVFKLQKRIYKASGRGDVKTVHRLQKLLMKSWSAKCLATRRVTQDNQGKKTAGIDGVTSLLPTERLELAERLKPTLKPKPVRRVWIPKPGTTEKRGLGIPVMDDRASQALVKLALEPEWEAKFEPNSYGFRPGRGCHDALVAIYIDIHQKPKYVLDADISKCFDHINHQALLDKLATFPTLRCIIAQWLKAGMMEDETLFPTTEGVPQGGVISPLLANIALHGLETAIQSAFPTLIRLNDKTTSRWQPKLIRYADDLVVLHPSLEVMAQTQHLVSEWLAHMGLQLKASKTRISHTLYPHENAVGFDFLGCTLRQFPVGKTHSGKIGGKRSTLLGFKTIIRPSRQALRNHLTKTKEIIQKHRSSPQNTLIDALNPVIRGWANYHSKMGAKHAFGLAQTVVFHQLMTWAKHRHPGKNAHWIVYKYWPAHDPPWLFTASDGTTLIRHTTIPIQRHIKVRGTKSPFDGDWVYWATRLGASPNLSNTQATLLKKQRGKCAFCGLFFSGEDLLEIDHIHPTAQGGRHEFKNWQLLHRHCHDLKTSIDPSTLAGSHDKSQTVEEPR